MAHVTALPDDQFPVAGWHYPGAVAEFRAWFPTDGACLAYLEWLRWPHGFQCPRCASRSAGTGPAGVYRCHGCRRRVSVTSGTMFDKTRVPLSTWFEAVWLFTVSKSGVSATTLFNVLPIHSYRTAWTMLAKMRQAISATPREPLTGRVEVDESLFGGPRTGKAGRGALGKTLVAGAIEIGEHGWGRARMAVIPDASGPSLRAFVTANIAPGTTVSTDGWPSYLPALEGYDHEPVNVSASGNPAHEALPAVHRLFALAKHLLAGTYHGGGSHSHLQEYLDEFTFRFNRRHARHRGLLFMRLLQLAVAAPPATYDSITGIERKPPQKPTHPTGATRRTPGTLETTPTNQPWLAPRPAS